VLAAVAVWVVEVPLLGIHLSIRFGSGHPQTIGIGPVIGVSLAASLLGWLLLAVLDQRTPHARAAWTSAALVALVASLALRFQREPQAWLPRRGRFEGRGR
jgi:apolipoprotein N-acyltransferase